MADHIKKAQSAAYPVSAIDADGVERMQPLLTGATLISDYMYGIPLTSPVTKQTFNDKLAQVYVTRALNLVEAELKIDIQPVKRRFRLPYNPIDAKNYCFLEVPRRPILQINYLAIAGANYDHTQVLDPNIEYPRSIEIWRIPPSWIESGGFNKGQVNLIPLTPGAVVYSGGYAGYSESGGILLPYLSQLGWVPSLWTVEATTGFCLNGLVPVIVNELIALKALITILNDLLPQFRFQSKSLSLDGAGQSVADNMSQLIMAKLENTKAQYEQAKKDLRSLIGNNVITTTF